MKLKTLFESKWRKWHKVFLWTPREVAICKFDYYDGRDKLDWTTGIDRWSFSIEKRWLCFVSRKFAHGKFYYWSKK